MPAWLTAATFNAYGANVTDAQFKLMQDNVSEGPRGRVGPRVFQAEAQAEPASGMHIMHC